MIKNSIIRAKINRSNINFKRTFLWDDDMVQNKKTNLFLKFNEKIIVFYKGYDNYSWTLTNKRFFIPNELITINLSDLIKVDFKNIIENPEQKMDNDKLYLYTKQDEYLIYVENKTWHLFYDIFSYIIMQNKR